MKILAQSLADNLHVLITAPHGKMSTATNAAGARFSVIAGSLAQCADGVSSR